ncbi:MAG: hypothetical protein J6X49_08255 [Victivallales bacterium]|nr:hypothetical protein [Victivallales bacterium]
MGEIKNLNGSYFDGGNILPPPPFYISDSELKNWSYNYMYGRWEPSYGESSQTPRRTTFVDRIRGWALYLFIYSIPVFYFHFFWAPEHGWFHKLIFSFYYAGLNVGVVNGIVRKNLKQFFCGVFLWIAVYALFDKQIYPWGMQVVVGVEQFICKLVHIQYLMIRPLLTILNFFFLLFISMESMVIAWSTNSSLNISVESHARLIQFCWMFYTAIVCVGLFTIFFDSTIIIFFIIIGSIVIPLRNHNAALEWANYIKWEEDIEKLPGEQREIALFLKSLY